MPINDLDGLLARQDHGLILRPQILALTAAGKYAFPRASCEAFASAMDELCGCLIDGRPQALGVRRDSIVLAWTEAPAAPAAAEPSAEWRNLALGYARRL